MTVTPRRARLPLFAATLSLTLSVSLFAQSPAPAKPTLTPNADTANPNAALTHLSSPSGVALSPDGATVAWILRGPGGSTLHLSSAAHPADRLTDQKVISVPGASGCSYASPVWSPDGQTLAFLSNCTGDKTKPGQQQIFLWTKSTGAVKQLSHIVGNIEQPAWSPDGSSIAFLFVENATRSAGALDAMKPWSGVIGEDGVEVQRVYSIDVKAAKGGWITPANLHVYEFAWSPNSMEITYIAANPPGENNWWVAKLYSGSTMIAVKVFPCPTNASSCKASEPVENAPTIILDPTTISGPLHGLQIAVPRYSPDGKQIAFIGGLMSDQGSTGGDVYVIDAQQSGPNSGQPTDITPGIDGTPCFEAWLSNSEIGFVEDRSGHTLLVDWSVAQKSPVGSKDLGEVSLSGGAIKDAVSLSKQNEVAFVQSSFSTPPEIFLDDTQNNLHQLTHLNDNATPSAKTVSLEWDNEGYHVQGWLTYPAGYNPAKKYPLIVSVHGGPSASVGARWSSNDSWSRLGYFEFQPNPRGSFGQGEKFVRANVKDFGYGDLRDILKGMDAVEAKVSIDKNREGITGWSYGGFMTMFAITQTHRFRAAVAGAGLSDWLSYYGENSIDQWMIPFFGASVYDDPAVYAKSSAITFIKNVKTPTLVIVGDRDGECPAPQSFEFWHALRDLGVKTQLVVYPDEGHGFRNPEHIRDRAERIARWFAENMPESSN